jgi:hypothetical protein
MEDLSMSSLCLLSGKAKIQESSIQERMAARYYEQMAPHRHAFQHIN